jgi:hypothetical protein
VNIVISPIRLFVGVDDAKRVHDPLVVITCGKSSANTASFTLSLYGIKSTLLVSDMLASEKL